MSDKTKKTRLTIPVVNLDKIFGPRDEEMEDSRTETKSRLVKKQEELAGLELDSEILDVEDRIKRRQRGETVSDAPKDSLGDKMMDKVIIPLMNKKLAEDDKPRDSDSTVDRALRIAERAVARGPPKGEGRSAMDELDKGINIFTKIRGLVEGEKAEKDETGEGTKKEVDYLSELDRGIDLVKKIRETFPSEGGGGGMSTDMIEFKRWEKEFDLKHKIADREERLARRKQDKDHDIELGKLGIEKERNDLLRDGFKRIGRAIGEVIDEEDEYEEEEESAPAKGRGQLIKEKCTECGAEVLIPPEAQVEGNEIKCSECPAIFSWSKDV